jgi:hypothetical protein
VGLPNDALRRYGHPNSARTFTRCADELLPIASRELLPAGTMMAKTANYRALRRAVTEAARQAFQQVMSNPAGESFYAFGLYTSADCEYLVPTANTEEALRRRASEYAERGHGDFEECVEQLRWNPCDWGYHCHGEKQFDEVQALLNSLPHAQGDAASKRLASLQKTFIDALRDLDKERFFGEGDQRARVVLLLLTGDQDDTQRLELVFLMIVV